MNKFFYKKYFGLLFPLVIIAIVFWNIKNDFYPQKTIAEYYKIINSQEKIFNNEVVTTEELKSLDACGQDQKCFKNYFYNYNLQNSLDKTFSNLSLLLQEHPEYHSYCHEITHGIGASELKRQGGDLGKTLEVFDTGKYFKNISTCGSGIFHGLIESAVQNITDKDQLVAKFKDICNSPEVLKTGPNDCIHGLGHATYIQTNYNLSDSLYVCDQVNVDSVNKFNCYSGIFMEANLDLPQELLISAKPDGDFDFKICTSNLTDLQKRACVFESTLQFRNLVKNRNDFGQVMSLCTNIKDPIFRMACVKNIAIRSIIDVQYADLSRLCLQSGLNSNEQTMCVAILAHRIAFATEGTKNNDYYLSANDICKNLKIGQQQKCQDLILHYPEQLYLVSDKDIQM